VDLQPITINIPLVKLENNFPFPYPILFEASQFIKKWIEILKHFISKMPCLPELR